MYKTIAEVSDRFFYYDRMELKQIRSKFRGIDIDIPTTFINKMMKTSLVRHMVVSEFDEKTVKMYEKAARELNIDRAFVEYGVTPGSSGKKGIVTAGL